MGVGKRDGGGGNPSRCLSTSCQGQGRLLDRSQLQIAACIVPEAGQSCLFWALLLARMLTWDWGKKKATTTDKQTSIQLEFQLCLYCLPGTTPCLELYSTQDHLVAE
ncbi:unnamed protein product [Natator depressus]